MKKTVFAIFLFVAFLLMIFNVALAKDTTPDVKFTKLSGNSKLKEFADSINANSLKMLKEITKQDKAALRGDMSTRTSFIIGKSLGEFRFIFIDMCQLRNSKEIKTAQRTLDMIKESSIKLGMPASIISKYDGLRDLCEGGLANRKAMFEKYMVIIKEVINWTNKELGGDKSVYFELGIFCGFDGTVTKAAIIIPNMKNTLTEMLLFGKTGCSSLYASLKDDAELPNAAKNSLAALVDYFKELSEKGASDDLFRKMGKAFDNVIIAIETP